MLRQNVSWTSASLPRGGGKRRRNYVTKRCEVLTDLHIDTDSEQVELAFQLTIRRDMITSPWIDVKPQSEHNTRSPNTRFGNSPDMVGTLHRQFTELLITATACKRTKNGGKRNHAQKTDQNPALEGDSESGKQHVGAIIFRNPELFHSHKWAGGAWSKKKHKRELGRRSLKNYNKQKSCHKSKNLFLQRKRKSKSSKWHFFPPHAETHEHNTIT